MKKTLFAATLVAVLLAAQLALAQSLATDRQVLAPGTWRARTGQATVIASEVRMGGDAGTSLQAWADDQVGSVRHPFPITAPRPRLNSFVTPGFYAGNFNYAPDKPSGANADALLVSSDHARYFRSQALIGRGWGTVWTRVSNVCRDPCTAPVWGPWAEHDLDEGVRTGSLEAFEAALRRRLPIADVSIRLGVANAAARLPGSPALPSETGDVEIVARVGAGAEYRVPLSDLQDVDAARHSDQLTVSNSIEWTGGSVTYRLARESLAGQDRFLFSASDVGTYALRIWQEVIDLQPWARRGSDLVPGSALAADQRLPAPAAGQALRWNATATAVENFAAGAGGLSQAQVDARVVAGTQPWARSSPTGRIPESFLPAKADDVLDAFDLAGWATEGSNATEDAALARVRSPALPTLAQARGFTYVDGTYLAVGPSVLPGWLTVRVPAALWDDVAGDELRLVGTYNPDDPSDLGDVEISSDWTLLGASADGTSYRYYTRRFTGLPAGHHVVQRYSPFRLDSDKVQVSVPYTSVSGRPQVTTLRDRAALTGLFVTSSGADKLTSLAGLGYDLDDAASGEARAEITFTISTPSDSQISFESGATVRTDTSSQFTFLSTLKSLSDWVPGGVSAGHQLGEDILVYRGATQIGSIAFFLGHDASNNLGYAIRYDGDSGTYTFSISTTLTMTVWST